MTSIPEWVRLDVGDGWRAVYHDGRLVGSGSLRAAEAQAARHRASLPPIPDSGRADGGSDSFEYGWEAPDAITKFGYADAPTILTDEDYAILLAWRSARRRRA
jgi:hypothetical protein